MADASPAQQWQDALQRPDIETITTRYTEALTSIKNRLSAELKTPPWKTYRDVTASSCGEYPAISAADTESRGVGASYFSVNIPDADWDRALKAVQEIASRYGFGTFQAQVDQPGSHEFEATDGFGGSIRFGTKKWTILSADTGCHLTAEAHKRGKPGGMGSG